MKTLLKTATNNKAIHIVDEMFSEDELQFLDDYCENELGEQSASNSVGWDKRLIEGISGDIRVTRTDYSLDPELYELIIPRCNEAFGVDIADYCIQLYQGEGKAGINWHTDGNYKAAISIYLTERWNRDYGGLFSFTMNEEDDGLYTSILPKRNRGLIQRGGVWHGVTSITDSAPIRKSLQIWIYELH